MNLENIKTALPSYARDIKLNLSSILSVEGVPDLSGSQLLLIVVASAVAVKNQTLLNDVLMEVHNVLSTEEIDAAKSAASIMAMNNVYYRFVHLVNDKSFATMPAKLRMNVIANPGVPKTDFELCCLAVSAINGCGMCIESHTHELLKAGMSKVAIQSVIRIAAVMNAVSAALSA